MVPCGSLKVAALARQDLAVPTLRMAADHGELAFSSPHQPILIGSLRWDGRSPGTISTSRRPSRASTCARARAAFASSTGINRPSGPS